MNRRIVVEFNIIYQQSTHYCCASFIKLYEEILLVCTKKKGEEKRIMLDIND